MKPNPSFWSTFFHDESAQDLIEYALVAALVGLGAIASIKSVGTSLSGVFTSIASGLNSSV